MLYDVFICHASEDKDDFVRPLALHLQQQHIEVWYVDFSLQLGDSIRRALDAGLGQSRFGVVVLSPAFFSKQWPQYELDGLAQREMRGSDRVILPVWHNVGYDDRARLFSSADGQESGSVKSRAGNRGGADHWRHSASGHPLIVARDILLDWGITPPVITDSYWLDVVEASNRVPGAGGSIPVESHWGRWSFPLPPGGEKADERGLRLAWTAMQLAWTEAAEKRAISPITPPQQVHAFIHEHRGLWEACEMFPHYLAEYAPQLTIPGFEGDLLEAVEKDYIESCQRLEASIRVSPSFGTAFTIDGSTPACEDEWALRHPEFGRLQPSTIANAYFAGGMFGPDVSPYEHADHLFWLLSDASKWLPQPVPDDFDGWNGRVGSVVLGHWNPWS